MIYILIGLSLLFFLIGFSLTRSNAKYFLAGYNTLSAEERKKFDIGRYVPYFRKFHFFLGLSLFGVGLLLYLLVGEKASGTFLALYPILAYTFFLWYTRKFSSGVSNKASKWAAFLLLAIFFFVFVLLLLGFQEDELLIRSRAVELEGVFGETIPIQEIEEVALVESLPEIRVKTSGFALGEIKKGYFRSNEGELLKLILNSGEGPFIFLQKKSGERIYYSSADTPNEEIYEGLRETFPEQKSFH